jgi:hypothetical protein
MFKNKKVGRIKMDKAITVINGMIKDYKELGTPIAIQYAKSFQKLIDSGRWAEANESKAARVVSYEGDDFINQLF